MAEGRLYAADNLDVLRGEYIAQESVDLVYLDPPFNSQRDYNILYRERDDSPSRAQIKAFEDSWGWDANARDTYEELVSSDAQRNGTPAALSIVIRALHDALPKRSDMFAYLVMMAPRLVELRRVLKPTGSLYLHCDPTASHYLKLLLDAIFGPQNFFAEIVWKRYGAHGDAKRYGAVHDNILFYGKTPAAKFKKQFVPYSEEYAESRFRLVDKSGRRYQEQNLSSPNPRPNLTYPYRASNGVTYQPHPNGWKCELEQMKRLDSEGRLHFPKNAKGRLRLKMFLDESDGVPLQDVWTDIQLASSSSERIGFPTQKPLALLTRILETSSEKGDVVLDPFCGCGTAVEAAILTGRNWIGIDITHLAIGVIRDRRLANFPGLQYRLFSIPSDLETARVCAANSPYEFQFWAARKIGAFVLGSDPHAREGKRGADRGVDGIVRFRSPSGDVEEAVVSVKGGHVNASHIRDLRGTMERRGDPIGIFLTLEEPTQPMKDEAVDAGSVRRGEEKFQRIQILTIEQLFAGVLPVLPGQKERAPKPGETLSLPGMERRAPPPPKGVLITVPEKSSSVVTPMMPAAAVRKGPKRAAGASDPAQREPQKKPK